MTDLTTEFLRCVESHGGATGRDLAHSSARSHFHQNASEVSRHIFQCTQKLGGLTKLVQKKTVFDTAKQDQNINTLTDEISQDITNINTLLQEAEAYVQIQKGRGGGQQTAHSVQVVEQLKSNLNDTTQSFKAVMENRAEVLKQQEEKRKRFGSKVAVTPNRVMVNTNRPLFNNAPALSQNGASVNDSEVSTEDQPLVWGGASIPQATHAQLQEREMMNQSQNYLDQRANEMEKIESHIVEIGQIFNKLGELVNEQDELATALHDNVEDSIANIDAGQNELIKAYEAMSGNGKLTLKIFAVLIIFMTLLVFVI